MSVIEYLEKRLDIPLCEVTLVSSSKDKRQVPYTISGKEFEVRESKEGYLRAKNGTFEISEQNSILFNNRYNLVLFLPKNLCDDDILNIIANIETARLSNIKTPEYKIKVNEYFLDSLKNIQLEFKADVFANHKVIIVDIEVKSNYCKNKINCNG